MYIWRAEPLGRPVGFEERVEAATVEVDLVLVGVHVVDVVVGVDGGRHRAERVGVQLVVVVEEGDELAGRHRQRVVGGGDDPTARWPARHPHASVGGSPVEDSPDVWLGRAVVDEAVLPVAVGLTAHRGEHRQQHVLRRVADRGEDREARRRHRCNSVRSERSSPLRNAAELAVAAPSS